MDITKEQIKTIHVLLAKMYRANDRDYKANLVGQYSNWRVGSTKGLFYAEADELIRDLRKMTGWTPAEVKANEKRRLILHYAHDMMWYKNDSMAQLPNGSMKPRLDMERIDNWCVQYGKYHKPLNDHSLGELSGLIYQFEKAFQSFLKSV